MGRATKRKQPITLGMIVGILESSALIDEKASEKQKQEAEAFGRVMEPLNKEVRELLQLPERATPRVIDLTGGYSIGMFQSAQVLAGLAAELALKLAYEHERPGVSAPDTHDLFSLYKRLTVERKAEIEADYLVRLDRDQSTPSCRVANS